MTHDTDKLVVPRQRRAEDWNKSLKPIYGLFYGSQALSGGFVRLAGSGNDVVAVDLERE